MRSEEEDARAYRVVAAVVAWSRARLRAVGRVVYLVLGLRGQIDRFPVERGVPGDGIGGRSSRYEITVTDSRRLAAAHGAFDRAVALAVASTCHSGIFSRTYR